MSKIISEYTGAFSTPLDNPYTNRLIRKQNATLGAEQLIRQYIAELLISFLRDVSPIHQRSQMSINRESSLVNMIIKLYGFMVGVEK